MGNVVDLVYLFINLLYRYILGLATQKHFISLQLQN